MIKVAALVAHLDAAIPFAWAAPWDRVGLLVGDGDAEVTRVLVSLDPTPEALDRAVAVGANVLVTHHPAFLDALDTVVAAPGAAGVAFEAARRGIALIACHTNLDRSPEGGDALPTVLGLEIVGPLEVAETPDDGTPLAGRLCEPGEARTLGALATLVGARLGVGTRVWGEPSSTVTLVGLAPGSGRSLVDFALAAGADALVTGELRYHVAHDALQRGLCVIEAGHDATEWPLTGALARIVERAPGLDPHDVITDDISFPWRMVTKGSECT
ncbi:MAG TPA: Nif3-like dinuclear metal center hexameric protein [Coriobacteriia bacterium]